MATKDAYAVTAVRGPFVTLDPHPNSFSEEDEDAFLDWAHSIGGPTAMDLFCGAGGLSLGLSKAGFEVLLGVDHDEDALATHRANFPGLSVNWDMADEDVINRVVRIGRELEIDLVAGGPPCQPFSKAGRSIIRDLVRTGRRDKKDQRRDLWQSFMAVVEGVKPRAVLMENVPDMALERDMQILRTMVELLEYLDYSVEVQVVESSKYEVPQFRHRLILVALADCHAFEWPTESGYQVTLRTAIGDLPPVEGGWRPDRGAEGWADYAGPATQFQKQARANVPASDSAKVFDHITRPVRDDDKVIFAAMDSSTAYSEIDTAIETLELVSDEPASRISGSLKRYRDDIFDDKYKRLDWDQVSRTITAHIAKDGYWYIHPDQDRTLTIREAARIQTFPDSYRFSGPPSTEFRQIGNAVPPALAEALGGAILTGLDNSPSKTPPTITIARRLAAWFETRDTNGELRFPWLSTTESDLFGSRWTVIQAELLLSRTNAHSAKTLWPLLSAIRTPAEALASAENIREIAGWIDRGTQADKALEAAAWFVDHPEALDTVDGMRSAPHVTEAVAEIAARVAPDPDEDPVLTTTGVLRVAARYSGTSVDRRNSRSAGRIMLARMIGAEDTTSDHAFLALIEIADTLCVARPKCRACPLLSTCATGRVS